MSDLFTRVPNPHVEIRDGRPFVRGTRVPVLRLWDWHRKGVAVATLIARYPSLAPSMVLDALSFAHDHPELMAADADRERLSRFD